MGKYSSWLQRPKYILFGFVALMVLVVLYKNRVLLYMQSPVWERYGLFKWWLLPHAVAGVLALFLGALQFSDRFRRRFLRWHRRIGRIYVCAVVIAAPLGAWIEYIKYANEIAPLRLVIAAAGFAILFLTTTGMGVLMARRRNFQAHRRWMIRSYAVGLVFLQTRFVDQIPWLTSLVDYPSTLLETNGISDLWIFIAFSLAVAELILLFENIRKKRVSAKKIPAPA